LEQKQVLILLV